MTEIKFNLDEYIESVLARSFEWGHLDCCIFGADWIHGRRGVDPMQGFRGTYHSKAEAIRLYLKHGGFEAFVGGSIDRAGLSRTNDPDSGDVGIVNVPVGMKDDAPIFGPVLAIRIATRWNAFGYEGLLGGDFDTRIAWRV